MIHHFFVYDSSLSFLELFPRLGANHNVLNPNLNSQGPFEVDDDWPVDRQPVAGAFPGRSSNLPPPRSVLAYFWSPDSRKLLYLTG